MSIAKQAAEADLPAPLSLTLDEVRNVAGGMATASVMNVAHWWWYGQPADPWLVTQVAVAPNVGVAQVGAAQGLGG